MGLARAELKRKGSPLEWEKAHAEIRGNELADHFANLGTKLPLPSGFQRSFQPWQVCINGEPFHPPIRYGLIASSLAIGPEISILAPTPP